MTSVHAIARPMPIPQPGAYLTDGQELYCVEEMLETHGLIEDCRTGVLIDLDLERLRELEPVRRGFARDD